MLLRVTGAGTVRRTGWATRLQTPALAAACVGLSFAVGARIAQSGALSGAPLKAVFGLAAFTIALSIPAETLFVVWLTAAPFLQESAQNNRLGHLATQAVYLLPPLVLVAAFALRRSGRRRMGAVDALPLAYLVYIFVSMRLVSSEPASLGSSLRPVYVTVGIGIFLYYFVAFGPTTTKVAERVAAALIGSGCVIAAMALLEAVTGWNLWHDTSWHQGGIARSVATLANPAVLGAYLGAGVVTSLAILLWNGPQRFRRPAKLLLVLALPALFVTYTRGPLLAVGAVSVAMVLIANRARWPSLLLLVTVTAILLSTWGSISATSLYQNRLADRSTAQTRVLLQDWSLELASQRPILGFGYGSFDRVKNSAGLDSKGIDPVLGLSSTSHDTFLTVLVELGAVGLALLIVPWVVIALRAVRSAREQPRDRWALVAAVGFVAVYTIDAGTLDMRFFSFLPALVWVMLGVARRVLAEREAAFVSH